MKIMSREQFVALEGNILFREVVLVEEEGQSTHFAPKPHSDPLMIRQMNSEGKYYESAVAEHSLCHLFCFVDEDDKWTSIEHELDLTPTSGCHENEYFLVYDQDDVLTIISALEECL